MTALENVRNYLLIGTSLTAVFYFVNDGKPKDPYCFKSYIISLIIEFTIYYFLGLFS